MSIRCSTTEVGSKQEAVPCPRHHRLSRHTIPLESVSLTMTKIPFIADLEGLCSRSGHHKPGREVRLGWREVVAAIRFLLLEGWLGSRRAVSRKSQSANS